MSDQVNINYSITYLCVYRFSQRSWGETRIKITCQKACWNIHMTSLPHPRVREGGPKRSNSYDKTIVFPSSPPLGLGLWLELGTGVNGRKIIHLQSWSSTHTDMFYSVCTVKSDCMKDKPSSTCLCVCVHMV